jgi:ribosomal protein S18 acetylase RimI-like enzyme
MPYVVPRSNKVQKLLKDNISGLSAYEAPLLVCPLKFELVQSAIELNKGDIDTCIGLVERTSGDDYRASRIGWNSRRKREEMMDKEMMYLLVRQGDVSAVAEHGNTSNEEEMENPHREGQVSVADQNTMYREEKAEPHMEGQGAPQLNAQEQLIQTYASDNDEENIGEVYNAALPKAPTNVNDFGSRLAGVPRPARKVAWPHPGNNGRILGFTSFMFTYDDPPHEDREVVYIYEIHLHERLRGHGIGSNLIRFVENAARECQVDKTMLTVFTANEGARKMYERLGYSKDECSPQDRVMRSKVVKADYVIMSKMLD